MKYLLLTAALFGCAAPAMAQDDRCFPEGMLEAELDANAGDQVAAELHAQDGMIFTLRAKPDGKWIVLGTIDGMTCIVATGEASVFKPMGEPA